MQIRTPAIVIASRLHGETALVARFLTQEHGVIASYVAGGRGRQLRPVMIAGNLVDLSISARSETQLPFAKVELLESRGAFLTEPLPAAAIGWVTALTAAALPERQAYPSLYEALSGLLDAICHAPSARGWVGALLGYETLMLREMGYGGEGARPLGELAQLLDQMDQLAAPISNYLLADTRIDAMAARTRLREMLARIDGKN